MQTTRVNVTNLLARTRAFVETLKGLAETEATTPASNEYAREYNRLRSDVAAAVPVLCGDLPTETKLNEMYNTAHATYVEIFTYTRQIFNLLNDYRNAER